MIRQQIINAASLEPVSVAEAKVHLRVDHADEDALIAGLIVAARQHVESYTGRVMMRQTRDLFFDCFADPLYLLAPLISVTSVKYTDAAGVLQTVSASDYVVIAPNAPPEPVGFVHTAIGKTWPSSLASVASGAVVVRAVVGAADPGATPAGMRQAILLLVGDWYTNREAAQAEPMKLSRNPAVGALLTPLVLQWF